MDLFCQSFGFVALQQEDASDFQLRVGQLLPAVCHINCPSGPLITTSQASQGQPVYDAHVS